MHIWCPQQFRKAGEANNVDPKVIENAIQVASAVQAVDKRLPPIFSLRHISHLTGVDYFVLRSLVERNYIEPYKVFKLDKKNKRSGNRGYRIISIPSPQLMIVQKWIAKNILKFGEVHTASFAYAENSKIIQAATLHCNCTWMIKLDVSNFFESFSEIAAYRVFRTLGYQPLISFEMSRLCTKLGTETRLRRHPAWQSSSFSKYHKISRYRNRAIGHLPQGAPTSPMLSNLAMKNFDSAVSKIALDNNLVYSRYADDLCLSTNDKSFDRTIARKVIISIYEKMNAIGLKPNLTKTQIVPPGARKIVLGLLVDGNSPKLSREFRAKLRMHFHFLCRSDIGPAKHAERRGFESVMGLKNHIQGLIAYARQIDPTYASSCDEHMDNINWPF
ncbi:RNA-directed DNA polymerase [Aliikangiella marina]|uniref:RNA-directed DNA polymerase n=1 Tax=Aliikangiella marina TaxID=1712262 RepID=A0A545T2G0_9GAMM|nr:reverse transcriptase family protein [Aliikangiella marina]TQV71406.1 RNA-directed DNA polymerase [Aliikangiella marina]